MLETLNEYKASLKIQAAILIESSALGLVYSEKKKTKLKSMLMNIGYMMIMIIIVLTTDDY